jgi:hypothetical protein
MIDAWPLLAKTKAAYHSALSTSGHDGRACDQFGTLLACAWLLLNDDVPDESEVAEWALLCVPQRLAEVSDSISDEEACTNRLMTELVQPRGRDSREAVSELVGRWIAAKVAGDSGTFDDGKGLYVEHLGLKVVNPVWHPATGDKPGRWGAESYMPHAAPGYLAVAARHQALDAIFGGRGGRVVAGNRPWPVCRGPSKWRRSALPGRRSARCWCRCTPSLILMSCHRSASPRLSGPGWPSARARGHERAPSFPPWW